jgi:hypothetical protein
MNKPEFVTTTKPPFAERYDNFIGGMTNQTRFNVGYAIDGSRRSRENISTTSRR